MKNVRSWLFRVQVETFAGEQVGVTGDCPQLGLWQCCSPSHVVLLDKEQADDGTTTWAITTELPANVDVLYRFYVCVVINDEKFAANKYVIRRWESNLNPRKISKDNAVQPDVTDVFGVYDNHFTVDRGWLTSETVVQLKLHSQPVHFWKEKLRGRNVNLKLTPVNLTRKTSDTPSQLFDVTDNSLSFDTQDCQDPTDMWPITEIAVMNEEDSQPKLQNQFGWELKNDDYVIFQVQEHYPENTAYLIDFYMFSSRWVEGEPPSHIGFSNILPSAMNSSEGHIVVPITSTNHRPIGQLSVYYVIMKPIPDFTCDMKVSYSKYWKANWMGLDVGHRGLGNSFTEKMKGCAGIRENTIASLKTAASHGADFVEFDVQLSKDLVPVIYHDFHVCISMKRKKNLNEADTLQIPVKDLTLEQLQSLKGTEFNKVLHYCNRLEDNSCWIYHLKESKDQTPRFLDEELEEHEPFPTLQHALNTIDPHVGFNVEVKWNMLLKDGTFEVDHPVDINNYLDCILKVVLENGGLRKIVFSCFHPDICTLIKLKQAKYPVIFLTQGETSKYPMYHDPRCHSIPMAVYYAISVGILGINVHTEDVLRDPSHVSFAKQHGLVIFCWGDDNNDRDTIQYLKRLGMNAVIYDKIDEYSSKEVKESIFLAEAREYQNELLKVVENINEPVKQDTNSLQVLSNLYLNTPVLPNNSVSSSENAV